MDNSVLIWFILTQEWPFSRLFSKKHCVWMHKIMGRHFWNPYEWKKKNQWILHISFLNLQSAAQQPVKAVGFSIQWRQKHYSAGNLLYVQLKIIVLNLLKEEKRCFKFLLNLLNSRQSPATQLIFVLIMSLNNLMKWRTVKNVSVVCKKCMQDMPIKQTRAQKMKNELHDRKISLD